MSDQVDQKPVDSGTVDSVSGVERVKQELEFERKEKVKFETEAKKAFKLRDEKQAELDALRSKTQVVGDDDTRSLITKLQAQVKEKEDMLVKIQQDQEKQRKMSVLTAELQKHGFKQKYMDKVENFVDLNRVDPNEPISTTIVVDAFKNTWADLFETNAQDETKAKQGLAEAAWAKPKLGSEMNITDYEAQYKAAIKARDTVKAQEILQKIDKIKGRL